jgi:hypothetical protein
MKVAMTVPMKHQMMSILALSVERFINQNMACQDMSKSIIPMAMASTVKFVLKPLPLNCY